jgi:hypothetical protein
MDGFANSSYGIIGALDLLNVISPKNTEILCDFLVEYGTHLAENVAETYYSGGEVAVEERLDELKGSEAKNITKYDNIKTDELASINPS